MTKTARFYALYKLAYFGPAPVLGSPNYGPPPPMTVGQVMYNVNIPSSPLQDADRRRMLDSIVNSGKNVNAPAKSLLNAGIGALAGNFISNALGAGPFMRGFATAVGAINGYNR
jgi:hypothetical protein